MLVALYQENGYAAAISPLGPGPIIVVMIGIELLVYLYASPKIGRIYD